MNYRHSNMGINHMATISVVPCTHVSPTILLSRATRQEQILSRDFIARFCRVAFYSRFRFCRAIKSRDFVATLSTLQNFHFNGNFFKKKHAILSQLFLHFKISIKKNTRFCRAIYFCVEHSKNKNFKRLMSQDSAVIFGHLFLRFLRI